MTIPFIFCTNDKIWKIEIEIEPKCSIKYCTRFFVVYVFSCPPLISYVYVEIAATKSPKKKQRFWWGPAVKSCHNCPKLFLSYQVKCMVNCWLKTPNRGYDDIKILEFSGFFDISLNFGSETSRFSSNESLQANLLSLNTQKSLLKDLELICWNFPKLDRITRFWIEFTLRSDICVKLSEFAISGMAAPTINQMFDWIE